MSTTEAPRRASATKRVAGVLVVVLLLTGWWFLLRPAALGGPLTLVTVTGQSMEPGMHTGDLAVVREGDDHVVGDVVAFRVPAGDGGRGGVVIHRIVGGDGESGFVMRGDNNDFDDPWKPPTADVVGELALHVPGAGRAVMAMADPVAAAAVFAALTVFLVLAGGGRREKEDDEVPEPVTEELDRI